MRCKVPVRLATRCVGRAHLYLDRCFRTEGLRGRGDSYDAIVFINGDRSRRTHDSCAIRNYVSEAIAVLDEIGQVDSLRIVANHEVEIVDRLEGWRFFYILNFDHEGDRIGRTGQICCTEFDGVAIAMRFVVNVLRIDNNVVFMGARRYWTRRGSDYRSSLLYPVRAASRLAFHVTSAWRTCFTCAPANQIT